MIDAFLQNRLERVARRERRVRLSWLLSLCWASAALLAFALLFTARFSGDALPGGRAIAVFFAVVASLTVLAFHFTRRTDHRAIARRIEKVYPELDGVLLTAVEEPADGRGDFLRHRVLHEAIARSQEQNWARAVPIRHIAASHALNVAALAVFVLAVVRLEPGQPRLISAEGVALPGRVTVNPGNASVERGDTLVVTARFAREVPAGVSMVIHEHGRPPRTIPLARSLADPVFGTTLVDVQQDLRYQLQYGSRHTPEFAVTVFEYPRLVRADASLAFPDYTKLPARRIEDTTRVTAVEGTQIDLALQLNKPVTRAALMARSPAAREVALKADPVNPSATLAGWRPEASGEYDLVLIDRDGRRNKVATRFVLDVQPNRPPEIRIAKPRGDVRPSPLEEVEFDGTVWDDFGTLAVGLAYTLPSGETRTVELGRGLPGDEKRPFKHLLSLEDIGVAEDELISWNLWADDIGPDGKIRRTPGDLYFAEVRSFEEVFRESQMPAGGDEQQAGGGGGGQTQRLTELQRQVLSATWKLHRDAKGPAFADDVDVVRESQQHVLGLALEAGHEARTPREQGLWEAAFREMRRAVETLDKADDEPAALARALPPEQAAYQALLKLQAHETDVARGRRGSGGGGGAQASQRQIDQLDLQQAENRYETQRQARAPQTKQQQEQLAALSRLQDLARRQQDLNARLQELQTALQEAKTEAQREEVRRELKRLEDEQRRMLADVDELRQRMEQGDTRSDLANERRQLDEARDHLQQAADATGGSDVGQALAAGTRGQRELQQARDDLRQQTSVRLAEDLREMRGEARDLSARQQGIEERLAAAGRPSGNKKSLSDGGADPALEQEITEQRERWNKLLDRARQVSEQSERSEPLVSKNLYDSVRRATQSDDASVSELQQDLRARGELTYDLRERLVQAAQSQDGGKALGLANDMLREGNVPAAGESLRRARTQVEELREGVQRAAERVLGDDAEQLKLAGSELEQLTDSLQGERTAQGGAPTGRQGDEAERQNGSAREGDAGRQAGRREAAGGELDSPDGRSGQPQSGAGLADSDAQRGAPQDGGRRRSGSAENLSSDRVTLETLLESGGDEGRGGGGTFADEGRGPGGPLTGGGFGRLSERLRDVERLLDSPDLRDAVATARERARQLRRDYAETRRKPEWAVVELEVVRPLVEVRRRIAQELGRRARDDSLAPIDHDPVPNRYAESVRRYYEELGRASGEFPRAGQSSSTRR